tara:strand:- start:1334 stop:1513 length:180 start_codon:yes stop_codon:yes gene_type:complete
MSKFAGINRNYSSNTDEKTPQEKQRELDEKLKEFMAKGGKVEKLKPMKPTKEQLRSWKI